MSKVYISSIDFCVFKKNFNKAQICKIFAFVFSEYVFREISLKYPCR